MEVLEGPKCQIPNRWYTRAHEPRNSYGVLEPAAPST